MLTKSLQDERTDEYHMQKILNQCLFLILNLHIERINLVPELGPIMDYVNYVCKAETLAQTVVARRKVVTKFGITEAEK